MAYSSSQPQNNINLGSHLAYSFKQQLMPQYIRHQSPKIKRYCFSNNQLQKLFPSCKYEKLYTIIQRKFDRQHKSLSQRKPINSYKQNFIRQKQVYRHYKDKQGKVSAFQIKKCKLSPKNSQNESRKLSILSSNSARITKYHEKSIRERLAFFQNKSDLMGTGKLIYNKAKLKIRLNTTNQPIRYHQEGKQPLNIKQNKAINQIQKLRKLYQRHSSNFSKVSKINLQGTRYVPTKKVRTLEDKSQVDFPQKKQYCKLNHIMTGNINSWETNNRKVSFDITDILL